MMSKDGLYNKSYFNRLGELSDLAPEVFKAFVQFDKLALSEGKVNKKVKRINRHCRSSYNRVPILHRGSCEKRKITRYF